LAGLAPSDQTAGSLLRPPFPIWQNVSLVNSVQWKHTLEGKNSTCRITPKYGWATSQTKLNCKIPRTSESWLQGRTIGGGFGLTGNRRASGLGWWVGLTGNRRASGLRSGVGLVFVDLAEMLKNFFALSPTEGKN
jgi:hypothetical protein